MNDSIEHQSKESVEEATSTEPTITVYRTPQERTGNNSVSREGPQSLQSRLNRSDGKNPDIAGGMQGRGARSGGGSRRFPHQQRCAGNNSVSREGPQSLQSLRNRSDWKNPDTSGGMQGRGDRSGEGIRKGARGGHAPDTNKGQSKVQWVADDHSTMSIATSKISIHPSNHLKQRQQERLVSHRELQEVRKHGDRFQSDPLNGQPRYKFLYKNLCYITGDEEGKHGITCFRISSPHKIASTDNEKRFMDAVQKRNLDQVKRLVADGVNPNITCHNGSTALMWACDVVVTDPNNPGGENTEVLEYLLGLEGIDLDAPSMYGNTCLHWSVARLSHVSVKLLLKAGADFTLKALDGKTPLEMAEDMDITDYRAFRDDSMTRDERIKKIVEFLQKAEDAFNASNDEFKKIMADDAN
jgi:hypothetical protein